jgi:succinoglycan biosynthesis protein ExoA
MTRFLCYHDVVAASEREHAGFPGPVSARYKLAPQQFERHLDALDGLDVALTFDDGGASALWVAEALERRGLRGHFFIVTGQIGAAGFLDGAGVRELADRGHAVGSHSDTHPPYIERLAPSALAREWGVSRERLGEVLGEPPKLAAVPGGRLSPALVAEVAAAGYEVLLSCEPTTRARRHGRLTIIGRYTIWSATPAARAAAYARGSRSACASAGVRWRIKRAARAASPAHYERARRARANLELSRSRADEIRQPAGLDLHRRAPSAIEPGGDQPLANAPVVDQPLDGGGGGNGVAGLHQHGAVAERAHSADGGGDARQSAGVCLDQDLRESLGVRDVQEHVGRAVHLEQSAAERDIAAQLALIGDLELLQAGLEGIGQAPLAADEHPPTGVAFAQQRQDVGEQQRILLGVEAPNRQQRQDIALVRAPGGAGPRLDVGVADQGDRRVEDPRGAPIALRYVGTDRHDRGDQREQPPAGFEGRGREVQGAAVGMAVADVCGEVLADAEHQSPAPDHRDQRERDRMGVWTERQNGVGIVERPPHAPERARNGAQHGAELREPRIVRERDEFDRLVEGIVGGPLAAVEAPEQPQAPELPGQRSQKPDESALAEHGPVTLPVEVVGVDDESHGRSSAATAVTVSVLIPVLDEGGVLERTVPTMLAQRLDGEIEFLFAEGRSSDGSREVLERFAASDPRVRVVDNASGRTPDGLNVAFANARGAFVARMDAHCFYPPTYLADGISRLERGDVDWVAGPAVPRADGGFSGTVALALCSPLGRGPSRRLAGPGTLGEEECDLDTGVFAGVWRTDVLARYGGWNPRWLRNQDSELAARFLADGRRIVSLPSMAATYVPRRTLAAFLRQYHEYGRYRALTLARHPLARRRSHALAPALVGVAAATVSPPRIVRVPARAALTVYATAVAAETARAARAAPLRDALGLPLAFVAMHVGWGAGMWRGFATAWRSSEALTTATKSGVGNAAVGTSFT